MELVNYYADHYLGFIWGLDYLRAFRALPRWRQRFVMILLGKLAWREMIGMRESVEKMGYGTEGHYAVGDGCDYYKDGKKWNW